MIAPDAYRQSFAEAQRAGAAGWVFHTAAGFELGKRQFVDALSAEERAALSKLK